MNTYGSGLGIAALIGLMLLVLVGSIVTVLAWLSWKWSRPGASFYALVFPLTLPLLGVLFTPANVAVAIVWVGIWTVIGLGIWGRALWLRPGPDGIRPSVRRRQREILVSSLAIGMLFVGWSSVAVIDSVRATQRSLAAWKQHEEDRARTKAECAEGRIVTQASAACYSADGRFVAALGEDLEVWDLNTGKLRRRWRILRNKGYSNPVFDKAGKHLAVCVGHEVEVFDVDQPRETVTLLAAPRKYLNHEMQLRFWDEQNAILILQEGQVHAFHMDSGETLPLPFPALEEPAIGAFAISDDQKRCALWVRGSTQVSVWGTGEAEPAWTAKSTEFSRLSLLEFSHDGQWLATATLDDQIVVWNAATGAEQQRLNPKHPLLRFAFSEDCQQLVAITKKRDLTDQPQIDIWNVSTGFLDVHHRISVSCFNVALSPFGREMAATDVTFEHRADLPYTLRRYDTTTGGEIRGYPDSSK